MNERKTKFGMAKKLLSVFAVLAILMPYCLCGKSEAYWAKYATSNMNESGKYVWHNQSDTTNPKYIDCVDAPISGLQIIATTKNTSVSMPLRYYGSNIVSFTPVPDSENFIGNYRSAWTGQHGNLNLNSYYTIGRIYIDEGVPLYVNTKHNTTFTIERVRSNISPDNYSYCAMLNADIDTRTYEGECYVRPEYFSYEWLHEYDFFYKDGQKGEYNPHFVLTVKDSDGSKDQYEIYLKKNELTVAANSFDKAFKKDDTIYVKPGTTVNIKNKFKDEDGDISRGVGNYTNTGNAVRSITKTNNGIDITTSNNIGDTGTIYWNNDVGSTCNVNIVVSNLMGSYLENVSGSYKASSVAANRWQFWAGYGSMYIKRDIYVAGNTLSKVKVTPYNMGSGRVSFDLARMSIRDMTGCLNTRNITEGTNYVEAEFYPTRDGIIQFRYTNYLGNVMTENWHIHITSDAVLAEKRDVQDKSDVQAGEAEKKSSSSGSSSNPSGNQSSGSNNSNNGDLGRNNSSGSNNKKKVIPSLSMSVHRNSSDNITYYYTTKNATDAMYNVAKRTQYSNGSLSDYVRPSSYYGNNYGWGVSNPSSFSVNVNADTFGEGYFDVTAIAANGDWNVTNFLGWGPEAVFKEPKITYTTKRNDDGTVTFDFNIKNATEAKYIVKRRKVKSDGKLDEYEGYNADYDSFPGKVVSNPNKFSVKLDTGIGCYRGYYDITVIARNTDDIATSYLGIGPNYINHIPTVGIHTTNFNKANHKAMGIDYHDNDNDKLDLYYYIQKKDEKSTYVKPSKNTIINNGVKGSSFEITEEQDGVGFYDITVLAVDEAGAYGMSYMANVTISNAPTMTYQIEGEAGDSTEGYVSSTVKRNVQKVNLNFNDKDENDNVMVWYFVSDKDYDEKEIFKDNASFYQKAEGIKTVNLHGNTGSINVDITTDDGTIKDKYLYVLTSDKYGAASYYKAGAFTVDDSPLELNGIAVADDEDEEGTKTVFGVGDTLKVMFQFNHTMAETAPNLYLKFGEQRRKQDSITFDGDRVIYNYEIKDSDENGFVSLDNLDYANGDFEDNYTRHNKFIKVIRPNATDFNDAFGDGSNVLNCVENEKYSIDTVAPEIESIEINYEKGENTRWCVLGNKVHLSNLENATVTVKYKEKVVGAAPTMELIQGDNMVSTIAVNNKEEYSITELVNNSVSTEGSYKVLRMSDVVEVSDVAGNKANLDNYEVSYKVDGEPIDESREVVIDNTVLKGKITKNIYGNDDAENETERAQVLDGSIYSKGTIINCFTEFVNGDSNDYKDLTELRTIKLNVYCNNNDVKLRDKNGELLVKHTAVSDDEKYTYLCRFNLSLDELPVSFSLDSEGDYRIVTIKEDTIYNTAINDVTVTATNQIDVDLEKSGFVNIDPNQVYNIRKLTDEQKEYQLYVLNEGGISMENIDVIAKDIVGTEIVAQYVGEEEIDGRTYLKYKYVLTYGGYYRVNIVNKDTNTVILNKGFALSNFINPGDTNNDGKVDVMDVNCLLRYLAKMIDGEHIKEAGDMDGDGETNIMDAVMLCRLVAQDPEIQRDPDGYII